MSRNSSFISAAINAFTLLDFMIFATAFKIDDRIVEYPELEGSHEDPVQLLTPQRATQKLNNVSKSITQTLLEHHDHFPGELAPVLDWNS